MKIYFTRLAYRQLLVEVKKFTHVETGAILIGRIINGDYYVFESLDSGINCRRSSVIFYRDNPYSEHLADVVRAKYEKAYAIGFWHRHPGNFDRFSYDDKEANIDMARVLRRSVISGLVNIYDRKVHLNFWEITLDNRYTKCEIVVSDEAFKDILIYRDIDEIENQIVEKEEGPLIVLEKPTNTEIKNENKTENKAEIKDNKEASEKKTEEKSEKADKKDKSEKDGFFYTIKKLIGGFGKTEKTEEMTEKDEDKSEEKSENIEEKSEEKSEEKIENIEEKSEDNKNEEESLANEENSEVAPKVEKKEDEYTVADRIFERIRADIRDLGTMNIICSRYKVEQEAYKDKLFLNFTKGERSCDICLYYKECNLMYFIKEEYKYDWLGFISAILKTLEAKDE